MNDEMYFITHHVLVDIIFVRRVVTYFTVYNLINFTKPWGLSKRLWRLKAIQEI